MSLAALLWAQRVRGVDAFHKSLLWSLACRHLEGGSVTVADLDALAAESGMSREMVGAHISSLEKGGFIWDAGQVPYSVRAGRTRQLKLNLDQLESSK
jgi:hypothetical protein